MILSIIIPAYNEEKRILNTIKIISDFFDKKQFDYEILVVDDGSTDNTKKCVDEIRKQNIRCLSLPQNRGKGYSVKYGIKNTTGDIKLYTDADMPFDINALKYSVQLIRDGADVVCGKRFFAPEYPAHRKIMSSTFGLTVKMLGLAKSDTQCGFKAFTRNAADEIFKKVTKSGFSFDVEVMLVAEKMKLNICSLPLLTRYKEESTVKPLRDTVKMIGELSNIYINNMHGIYGE